MGSEIAHVLILFTFVPAMFSTHHTPQVSCVAIKLRLSIILEYLCGIVECNEVFELEGPVFVRIYDGDSIVNLYILI